MRISLKLVAGFLLIAAMVGVVGYLSWLTNQEVERQLELLGCSAVVKAAGANEMSFALCFMRIAAHDILAEERRAGEDPEADAAIEHWRQSLRKHQESFGESLARNRAAGESLIEWAQGEGNCPLAEQERTKTIEPLERLAEEFSHHVELIDEFLTLTGRDLDRAAVALDGPLQQHFDDVMLPLIDRYRKNAETEATQGIRSVQRALVRADERNGIATVVVLAMAVLLGLVMSRFIGKPLAALTQGDSDIGKGRWNGPIRVTSRDELGLLAQAFNTMVSELQEKTVSKAFVDNIIQSMHEILVVADPEWLVRRVNPAGQREFGCAERELFGKHLMALFVGLPGPAPDGRLSQHLMDGTECMLVNRTGEHIPVHCSASELRDESGQFQGVALMGLNITEQRLAEERLRASLHAKEVLLKEIHHRVKNNLQVISSLLNLQSRETPGPQVKQFVRESQARNRSMALIHEELYRSDDLTGVDFSNYVRQLADHLAQAFGTKRRHIRFQVDVEPILLPLDIALPCGMIVNDLVCNSIQHAFPDGQGGGIRVGFRGDGRRFILSVRDTGIGVGPETELGKPTSLGLKVAEALAKQVDGELVLPEHGGADLTVHIPCPVAPPAADRAVAIHGPQQ